jgi:hypothetical protein
MISATKKSINNNKVIYTVIGKNSTSIARNYTFINLPYLINLRVLSLLGHQSGNDKITVMFDCTINHLTFNPIGGNYFFKYQPKDTL